MPQDNRGQSYGQQPPARYRNTTLPGNSLADLQTTVLEETKHKDDAYRKEREEYYIRKFNTFHNGLNKKI